MQRNRLEKDCAAMAEKGEKTYRNALTCSGTARIRGEKQWRSRDLIRSGFELL